jgi:hypothetical protein
MSAKPSTLHGRLAELNPFDNGVTVKAPQAVPSAGTAAWREECTDNVSADELYGCVDWYQYPARSASVDSGAKVN